MLRPFCSPKTTSCFLVPSFTTSIIAMLLLTGCLFTYEPPLIPLQVSVSGTGKIAVAINGEMQTPIGTFGFEVLGWELFPEKRTFTVIYDRYSIIYEIPQNQPFDFQFAQEDLYSVHFKRQPDGNLFLELHSKDYTPANNNATFCPGAPPPRMQAGLAGRVTYTTGVLTRLRTGPGLDRSIKRLLPEGTTFTVIEGPICADAYNWWHIRIGGTRGWIAEGEHGNYFIEPYP